MVTPTVRAFVGVFMLLLLISAFRAVDHDEGQYVAAVALMRSGLPFRDFAYLQTPLQPLLFAPLAWLCEGWLFPVLRAVNAACAAGAAVLLALAVRRAGGSWPSARCAALGLAGCHAILFAATVARNDALPLLLHMAGLWLFVPIARGDGRARPAAALCAGLAFGAAASAKISFALPAAAVGLFALLQAGRIGWPAVFGLALGGVGGALPTVLLWVIAPEAAWFGIIDYSLAAPVEWRLLNGQAAMLAWPLSLLRLLRFLAQGVALVALIAVLGDRLRRARDPAESSVRLLLDLMIVAGLAAAWAPRPIYAQYLVPLLPALVLRFGLMLDAPAWRRPAARGVLAAFLVAGVAQTMSGILPNMLRGASPVVALVRDAQAVGRSVRAAGLSGPVVSLSPERVVDSGVRLDPRFAAGPFVFRTRGVLTERQAEAFHVVTAAGAAAGLSRHPPSAILTGYEMQATPAAPDGLERPLRDWAHRHNYRAIRLPSGEAMLFLRPAG